MVNIGKKEEMESLFKYIEYPPKIKLSLVLQMIGSPMGETVNEFE